MRNSRKMAYQAEQIERLRNENESWKSEIKAIEIELETAQKLLRDKEHENEVLKEDFEKYMESQADRIKALAETEKQYNDALAEMKEMKASYKKEVESMIAEIQRVSKTLN